MKCKRSAWSCPYHACMSDECQRAEVIRNGSNFGVGICRKIDDKSIFSRYLVNSKTLPINFDDLKEERERIKTYNKSEINRYLLRGEVDIKL